LLLVGVMASGTALAQRHYHGGPRASFGFYFGGPIVGHPFYRPYYYAPYYYPPTYYPPVVVAPPVPQVYIEQGGQQSAPEAAPQSRQAAPQQAPEAWWYYCVEAQGYYPYVNQCPGGWQRVAPQPPG